ncbi:hypothetical protein D1222_03390 [Henriciella algicola]|uniref:Uncharacterized protein n=1 Tax=Henriciella algicola TaxID=1608422 RepID=A0A399RJ75_9PROT|nr:hypothetical protein D1222_03390 [Henriciella algicola]
MLRSLPRLKLSPRGRSRSGMIAVKGIQGRHLPTMRWQTQAGLKRQKKELAILNRRFTTGAPTPIWMQGQQVVTTARLLSPTRPEIVRTMRPIRTLRES